MLSFICKIGKPADYRGFGITVRSHLLFFITHKGGCKCRHCKFSKNLLRVIYEKHYYGGGADVKYGKYIRKRADVFGRMKERRINYVTQAIQDGKIIGKINEFSIPELSIDELMERACMAHNMRYRSLVCKNNVTLRFMHRLCVNYLRHECTDYDKYIRTIEDTTRSVITEKAAIIRLRKRILRKIADLYPILEEECMSQTRDLKVYEAYV